MLNLSLSDLSFGYNNINILHLFFMRQSFYAVVIIIIESLQNNVTATVLSKQVQKKVVFDLKILIN